MNELTKLIYEKGNQVEALKQYLFETHQQLKEINFCDFDEEVFENPVYTNENELDFYWAIAVATEMILKEKLNINPEDEDFDFSQMVAHFKNISNAMPFDN